jgi:hypothetical protein
MARKKRSGADRAMLGSARRLGSGTTRRTIAEREHLAALKARISEKTFTIPTPNRIPIPNRKGPPPNKRPSDWVDPYMPIPIPNRKGPPPSRKGRK